MQRNEQARVQKMATDLVTDIAGGYVARVVMVITWADGRTEIRTSFFAETDTGEDCRGSMIEDDFYDPA